MSGQIPACCYTSAKLGPLVAGPAMEVSGASAPPDNPRLQESLEIQRDGQTTSFSPTRAVRARNPAAVTGAITTSLPRTHR